MTNTCLSWLHKHEATSVVLRKDMTQSRVPYHGPVLWRDHALPPKLVMRPDQTLSLTEGTALAGIPGTTVSHSQSQVN